MLQLCILGCRASNNAQIANKAARGELPGHSTASNIVANYSFGNVPSEGVIIYSGQGPQVSYLPAYHTIGGEIKTYLLNTYKEHYDKYKSTQYQFYGCFCLFLVIAIIIMIIIPIVGLILFLLSLTVICGLVCYQNKLYEQYTAVLLPGIINYVQTTLLPKYANGNNMKAHILFPVTWGTSASDCNCQPLQWLTIRFTLGDLQQPYGGTVHWSSDGKIQPYVQQLPPGWRTGRTNEGRVYYVNDVTKSTQWQHPGNMNGGMTQSRAPMQTDPSLPPGWQTRKTKEGRVYYVDTVNKKTQWEHPSKVNEPQTGEMIIPVNQNVQQNVPIQVQQANQAPSGLPNGWRMLRTNDGRVYYLNDFNQTTQWEHPGLGV